MKIKNKKIEKEFSSTEDKLLLKIKRDYDIELEAKRRIESLIAKDLKKILGNKSILVSNNLK